MILNNYFTESSFTFVQRVNQVDVFFLRLPGNLSHFLRLSLTSDETDLFLKEYPWGKLPFRYLFIYYLFHINLLFIYHEQDLSSYSLTIVGLETYWISGTSPVP